MVDSELSSRPPLACPSLVLSGLVVLEVAVVLLVAAVFPDAAVVVLDAAVFPDAPVEMVLFVRSFVPPFVERLAPANTVIQQTPTRKRTTPVAFKIAVQQLNTPPGFWLYIVPQSTWNMARRNAKWLR